jgi:chromosome segregation ATPase
MSVPTEALRRFWNELRERARIDLQHADLPEQLRQSAGQLIGEIWSMARQAADDSTAVLRQNAAQERDAALADKVRREEKVNELSLQLEGALAEVASAQETIGRQREELSAGTATLRETNTRLAEARTEIERLRGQLNTMSGAHAAEIDKITGRVVQAEQRYTDLEKRTLVDLDRERTALTKLQKEREAERRATASREEEMRTQIHTAQIQMARQDQELSAYKAKAELLAEERDRSARQAAESTAQGTGLVSQLAAERARVAELREQLDRIAGQSRALGKQSRPASTSPRRRQRVGIKSGK